MSETKPDQRSSSASACSHGGDKETAVRPRSHDRARFEEQCEWVRQLILVFSRTLNMYESARPMYAEKFVAEFRERFEPTADDRQSGEPIYTCGECGGLLSIVRPGKHACYNKGCAASED